MYQATGRLYKSADETLDPRNRDRLMKKTTWYKSWSRGTTTTPDSPSTSGKQRSHGTRGAGSPAKKPRLEDRKLEVAGALFIQRTAEGKLAEALRREEQVISKLAGYKVYKMERAGSKLEDLLTRSDPFSGADCQREKCYPCLTKAISLKWLPCWRVNCTYIAECFKCKEEGKKAVYHGESGKSLHIRSQKHMEKLKSWDQSNFMLRHNLLYHPEDDPLEAKYLWYPTGFYQKAMERQISEAIKIKEAVEEAEANPNFILMNANTEYNCCVLPGITMVASKEDQKQDEDLKKVIMTRKRQCMRSKNSFDLAISWCNLIVATLLC